MNDSLRTEVFVRYDPETIACACIYLSARLLQVSAYYYYLDATITCSNVFLICIFPPHFQIPLPNKPAWYLVFAVSEQDINDISHSILSLYSRKKVSHRQFFSCSFC